MKCNVERNSDGTAAWRYCVDEFYDEGECACTSIEEGKQQAEEWYLARLLPALEEAC